jgi:hypothetical protein
VSVVKSIVYTECGRDQFVTIRSSRSLSELTQHATEICEKPCKHGDSEKIEEREEGLKTRPRAPTNSENGRRERTSPETRNICFRAARTPSDEPCRFSYLQRQLGRGFRAAGLRFRVPSCQQLFPLVPLWGIQSVSLWRVGLRRPGIDVSEYQATILGAEMLRDC